MSFGYSRDIFRYPVVQYIPLARYNSEIISRERNSGRRSFYVYNYLQSTELNQRLVNLSYGESYHYNKDQLAIIVYNYKIDIIKYRGHDVIMVGEESPGEYHIFAITTKYFYKDKLAFILYDGESSQRISLQRVDKGRDYYKGSSVTLN